MGNRVDKDKKERPTTGMSTGEEVEVQVLPESGSQPIAKMKTWERDGEMTAEQILDISVGDNLDLIGATRDVLLRKMYGLTEAQITKLVKVTEYTNGKPSKNVIKKFNMSDNTTQFLATKELLEFHAPKTKINLTINLHKHMEVSDARRDESKARIRSKRQIKS